MIVVTAYTSGPSGGGYDAFLPNWRAGVEKLTVSRGRALRVLELGLGEIEDWKDAAHLKPFAILSALEYAAFYETVLWLDVDSYVEKSPPTLYFDADLAFRKATFRGETHYMTGTLFVRKTPATLDFVRQWWEWSKGSNLDRNQLHFEGLLEAPDVDLSVEFLPAGYTFVAYDDRDRDVPEEERYIVHFMHAKKQKEKGRR